MRIVFGMNGKGGDVDERVGMTERNADISISLSHPQNNSAITPTKQISSYKHLQHLQ